jgi:hypothetical protein
MRRIHLISAAIIAMLALTAIAAIASAAEPTKILPEPTAMKPVTATAVSGTDVLEDTHGTKITCKEQTGSVRFTTPNLGTDTILFQKCTSEFSTTCTGAGTATGTISQSGSVHYILALEMLTSTTSSLIPAFAFLVRQFHFTCSNNLSGIEVLVLVRGCVAVKSEKIGTLSSISLMLFEQFDQGETKILSILMEEAKAETKCLLESSISTEAFEENFTLAALEGPLILEKWTQNGVEITVLLMN